MTEEIKIDNTQQINEVQQNVEQQETEEQINWKKFRQQRDEDARRAKEAEERAEKARQDAEALRIALESVLNKKGGKNEEDYSDYAEDDDVKIEKKLEKLLAEREEKTRRYREEQEQRELPLRLKSTYNDFDKVCNQENLDYLEYHYPEIAKAFQHMPNNFDKWASVYRAVKRFLPQTNLEKSQKKIEENLSKPQSMNSGLSQTGDTSPRMILDEKRKAENWMRMRERMKGV